MKRPRKSTNTKDAQLAIVVCGSLDNGLPGRGKEYWIHDCSLTEYDQ